MHVMIEITIALLFLGIFAGLLSGFFGIGSGIILVPAYIFLFEFLNFPKEIQESYDKLQEQLGLDILEYE